jgi:hypothetical protein
MVAKCWGFVTVWQQDFSAWLALASYMKSWQQLIVGGSESRITTIAALVHTAIGSIGRFRLTTRKPVLANSIITSAALVSDFR